MSDRASVNDRIHSVRAHAYSWPYVNRGQNQESREKKNIEVRDRDRNRMNTTTEIIMQIRQIKRRMIRTK